MSDENIELYEVFLEYCNYGSGRECEEIDSTRFARLVRQLLLVDRNTKLCIQDADVAFHQILQKTKRRRLDFDQFVDVLQLLAAIAFPDLHPNQGLGVLIDSLLYVYLSSKHSKTLRGGSSDARFWSKRRVIAEADRKVKTRQQQPKGKPLPVPLPPDGMFSQWDQSSGVLPRGVAAPMSYPKKPMLPTNSSFMPPFPPFSMMPPHGHPPPHPHAAPPHPFMMPRYPPFPVHDPEEHERMKESGYPEVAPRRSVSFTIPNESKEEFDYDDDFDEYPHHEQQSPPREVYDDDDDEEFINVTPRPAYHTAHTSVPSWRTPKDGVTSPAMQESARCSREIRKGMLRLKDLTEDKRRRIPTFNR
eukprot:TRINITY_DN2329_c2_g1_i1.p1 TRINITY_DN2329_c2_g1~~TRINITY_DN2329_c2_g1_i1.p1  ORF type:complete len:367 (+),score=64.62 TRINITY_DN2329_c2_g1_i1:23-1102(+)